MRRQERQARADAAAQSSSHAERMEEGRRKRHEQEERKRRSLHVAEQGWDDSWADDHIAAEGKGARLDGSVVQGHEDSMPFIDFYLSHAAVSNPHH